ncbi:MAG: hypothetical protein AAGA85_24885 [Bacteroidota bacterium]
MIHSRPQSNALFAVGLFVVLTLAADLWIVIGLINDPSSYFLAKLLLVPILFVIAIIVMSKSYFSSISLKLGNNQLTYRYPLGAERKHKLSDVSGWHENVVQRKSSTYRRLSIRLVTGKKLLLSNHENSDYDKVVSYLKKKVKN